MIVAECVMLEDDPTIPHCCSLWEISPSELHRSSADLQSLSAPLRSFLNSEFLDREPQRELHTHRPPSCLCVCSLPSSWTHDDDDDGNFTKWMSSYWGHGGRDEREKERKRSFRRSRQSTCDRRASLPCMSQLEAMRLKHPSTPTVLKGHEKEVRPHPHARRVSSDEYRGHEARGAESRRSTIPELTESFRRMLRFHNHRSDSGNVCLICHEEMCRTVGETGGAGHELHCSYHFHKEVRRSEQGMRPRSRSSAAVCENRKEVPVCSKQEEYRLPHQRRSLRRQR
ncbi:leukemia NUP98 fusion partner 1 [Neoarius graeffei]|uniref:leukemia NUP98 fusion partner 1 n=1 Tax=Neoarius graeffei TaxID=443677 RepID=UPI00298C6364|nr:leukemia NUP98 fusion partner 1 [Neoarius graeffei]